MGVVSVVVVVVWMGGCVLWCGDCDERGNGVIAVVGATVVSVVSDAPMMLQHLSGPDVATCQLVQR